jgi:hypothetical protein
MERFSGLASIIRYQGNFSCQLNCLGGITRNPKSMQEIIKL